MAAASDIEETSTEKLLQRLTPEERAYVDKLNANPDLDHDKVLALLKAHIQTAIDIELSTIPIYLFTYYALKRNAYSGDRIRESDLFANKAGGIIMSVAVEEMLHMSLSCNLLYSLGTAPLVYKRAPASYPTPLPHHQQGVEIPLTKLTFDQLLNFLKIEKPEEKGGMPEGNNWETIGQFYSYIRCLICSKYIQDADFTAGARAHQIGTGNYSPNNIDTIYPAMAFDPWKPAPSAANGTDPRPTWAAPNPSPRASAVAVYPDEVKVHDEAGGGPGHDALTQVSNKWQALDAIETICEQGEGYLHDQDPQPTTGTDDEEESHYEKFLTLLAQFPEYIGKTASDLGLDTPPALPAAVSPTIEPNVLAQVQYNFPDNPKRDKYPADCHAYLDFCNGVFQYMLILTETIFKFPSDPDPAKDPQKRFFNEGLHRSMIWVLDKWIQFMRTSEIKTGDYAGLNLAPTFEWIDLGSRAEAFGQLKTLGEAAIAAAGGPDSYGASIVATAISLMDGDHPMHLPDVSALWSDDGTTTGATRGEKG